jgi:hypothetical protein
MLIIGVDKFENWGPPRETKHGKFTPIDNCIEYKSFDYHPCDSGFVIGEYFEDEDVDIKLVSDIENEKYIYPVCVRNLSHSFGFDSWSNKTYSISFLDIIDTKVINHFRSGQAKLLIYFGYEGDSVRGDSIMSDYDRVKIALLRKEIPLKNVIYCDSNVILKKQCDIKDIKLIPSNYCTNTYYRFNSEHKQNLYHGSHTKSIKNRKKWEDSRDKIRDKYFLCYNRLPKSHRALMVLSLFKNNNLDKGIVSFPAFGMSTFDIVERKQQYLKLDHYRYLLNNDDLSKEYEKYSTGLLKKLPLELDKSDWTTCHSITITNIKHYLDSYFTICNEAHFSDKLEFGNNIFFTEKILKPILNFHPFIHVGNVHSLEQLRKYGFKTFSPFINESYDDIGDSGKRFLEIEKEINRLCSKSIEEIHEWYWSMEDILKHNYYHFYQKFAKKQKLEFLNKLENIQNEK